MERIILDTDLGMGAIGSDIDDGFALALAHAEPDISIELITTVNGNTDVETATALTLNLVHRLGIDAPVVKGAAAPFVRPADTREPRADVIREFGAGLVADPGYAAARIADLVMANPGEITIVAIGPLTNVAAALSLEPRLASSVKEILIMGGVFQGTMPVHNMPGEFNVWVDPEAAAAVLHAGAPLRWVGLDVTLKVRLTREDAARLRASGRDFAAFAAEASIGWIDFLAARDPGDADAQDSCAMHDPLAVAALTRPDLLTWQDAAVDIVTGESIARGVMVTDLLRSVDHPPSNCRIAADVDAEAFMAHFLAAISSL